MPQTDKLTSLLSTMFNADPAEFDDNASPDTIAAWDSLKHFTMVLELEKAFGISIKPEETLELRTVGLIREFLTRRNVSI